MQSTHHNKYFPKNKKNIPRKIKKGKGARNPYKYFKERFPHLPNEAVRKYFNSCSKKEAIEKLVEFDFNENFKPKYYNNFKINEDGSEKDIKDEKKCVFYEKKGDLFESEESICHCVSECLKMSKGIAILFVKKFGSKKELKEQKKKVSEVAYLEVDESIASPEDEEQIIYKRYIFYLITKRKYFMIPSYENLYKSLLELNKICIEKKIKKISMPTIACGLDRLKWIIVKNCIINAFYNTDIEITIYHYNK